MNGHNGPTGNFSDSDGVVREQDRARMPSSRRRGSGTGTPPSVTPLRPTKAPLFTLDAGSILRPASRRWYWLVLGGLIGAGLGALYGVKSWATGYSASAQLVRQDAQITGDAYRPQLVRGETLASISKSPELIRAAAQRSKMPEHTLSNVGASFERQSDIVNIFATATTPESAVALANAFNEVFIEWTQENQRQEAIIADKNNTTYIKDNEADLAAARKMLPAGISTTAIVTAAPAPDSPVTMAPRRLEQIQKAEEELADALAKYTDIHPAVRSARLRVAQLKTGLPSDWSFDKAMREARARNAASADPAAATALDGGPSREEQEIAFANIRTFENLKNQLIARQRAIELFKANPPGNFRVLQPATKDSISVHKPMVKIVIVAAFCGMIGFFLAGAEVVRREIFDVRLKTEDDVTRVTGLPVISTLGNIERMSQAERDDWAFRTWIALQDRLAYSPNHGLICGFTSSNEGEGRTTWISLLAGAARKCGFRVLTVATRSTEGVAAMSEQEAAAAAAEPVAAGAEKSGSTHAGFNGHTAAAGARHAREGGVTTVVEPGNGRTSTLLSHPGEFGEASRGFKSDSDFTALTASALFTPAMVTEKLTGPESDPLVHIPLP
ncbi:MAG: hypothetical protein V4773_10340, partial [Verrucomicrobiota bacterium]